MKNIIIAFSLLIAFIFPGTACVTKGKVVATTDAMNHDLPEALPHGHIEPVTDDVFYVMGTNVVDHANTRLQTSRTMTIIRDNGELTLINSIESMMMGLRS